MISENEYSETGSIHDDDCCGESVMKSPVTPDDVSAHVERLKRDIRDGVFSHRDYPVKECDFMALLVKQANTKYPGLNLHFVHGVKRLGAVIKKLISSQAGTARLIVYYGLEWVTRYGGREEPVGGDHFTIIDYKIINKRKSLILLDAAKFDYNLPEKLANRVRAIITDINKELVLAESCCLAAVEMDIQRSTTECGIFSLAIAKKLYRNASLLEKMHRDNVRGYLLKHTPERDCVYDSNHVYEEGHLPYQEADKYLPVSFYKHVQGNTRLEEYLNLHPEARNKPVNKKGETIFQRREKNLARNESGKNVSVSISRKRLVEYQTLFRMMSDKGV